MRHLREIVARRLLAPIGDGKGAFRFRAAFASTLGFDVVSRALSLVATVVLIRGLEPANYAAVVLFLAVGQFIGGGATGGIRMYYLRSEAERVSRGESGTERLPSALAAQAMSALLLGFLATLAADLGLLGHQRHVLVLAAFGGLYAMAQAGSELLIYHQQAHLRFARAGVINVSRGLVLLVVACTTFLGVQSGVTLVLVHTAALMALTVALAWPMVRRLRLELRGFVRGYVLRAEAGWLTLHYLASAGFAQMTVFVAAATLDESAVASYGAAQRYYAVVLGAYPALLAVTRVRTSQADIVDSPSAQRAMLDNWMRRAALPMGLLSVVIAVSAVWLIPVVDNGRYPDSIPIFQLLMVSAFANYVATPAPNLLMSQRRFRSLALVLTGAAVLTATLGGLVAPASGIVSLAIVLVVIDVSVSFGTAVLARQVPASPPIPT